jgi:hypothetical protein
MKIRIGDIDSLESEDAYYESDVLAIHNDKDERFLKINLEDKSFLIIYGTLYSMMDGGDFSKYVPERDSKKISSIFSKNSIQSAVENIDGRFIGILVKEKKISVFGDRHGRVELYYIKQNGVIVISNSIDSLINDIDIKKYDQVAIASILGVYGNYSPKKHTIYKNIRRLGVGEHIRHENNETSFLEHPFKPKSIENYSNDELKEYSQIFRNAIKNRSSNTINWVYMSSGWDSSAVLAMLCNLHGHSKVRAVIGRATYSNHSGTCNEYEIKRAKSITDYFNVELDIVELDYTGEDYLHFWSEIRDDLKKNHLYALFTYNFFFLAKHIKENGKETDAVFNGEYSDGAHNLGFSQFATILEHPDLNFREYSDKMGSYLYGPSFFESIENDTYSKDVIFNLLNNRGDSALKIKDISDDNWKYKYISSFFLSSARVPFSNTISNTEFLTKYGKKQYTEEINSTYFEEFVGNVTAKTLYSWILHLYNSFHWQGSTVRGMNMSAEVYDLQTSAPFSDPAILEYLSKMPESWGRGLDFNRTKYPLKSMLENEIDYPLDFQVGPHSYLYDTNPNWSADADIIYDSAGADYFKSIIKPRPYEDILDPKYFNIKYIDNLVDDYCNGVIENGQRRTDLKNIISFCNIGWY